MAKLCTSKFPQIAVLVIGFLLALNPLCLSQQTEKVKVSHPKVEWAPGELLVGFYPGATANERSNAHNAIGATVIKKFQTIAVHRVKLPKGLTIEKARQRYKLKRGVKFAEPNYKVSASDLGLDQDRVSPAAFANDPDYDLLYSLNNTGQTGGTVDADIDAPEAWDITTGSQDVIVAIIDTGVDYTHPDLAANMWTNDAELNGTEGVDDDGNGFVDDIYGYDFCNDDGDPMDDRYHGTHVAGTIGAVGNNGIGITGVAWNVKIMALKFLGSNGTGLTSDAISCVDYATAMGAHLTNNSWGGGGFSQAMKDAIDANGKLFVAAAGNNYGNDNDVYLYYPAGYECANVLSVMSTDYNDEVSSFSNFGVSTVDVAAPGSRIYSTFPSESYDYLNGTSMATPHVSGLAVLLLADNPSLSTADLKKAIITSGDFKSSLTGLCRSGRRINAYNALTQTYSTGSLQVNISPAEAIAAGAQWSYDAADQWYDSGQTATNVPTGTRTIIFKSVSGWTEPVGVTVTINDGQLTTSNNDYYLSWPGPDAYGYTGALSASEIFEDIEDTGTLLSFDDIDEGSTEFQPGFNFNFYGQDYSTIYVFTNGAISFDENAFADWDVNPLPHPQSPALFIAPWWDDLALVSGNYVKYEVSGVAPNRKIIIQWNATHYWWYSEAYSIKFQLKLYEADGKIVFAYSDIIFGDSYLDVAKEASIGIQNADKSTGLQFNYLGNRPPSTDYSVVITPTQPQAGSLQVDISPQSAIDAGAQWTHNLSDDWFDSGQTVENLPCETVTISFKELAGWSTPADIESTILDGQTNTESGTYSYEQNGNLKVDILPAEAVSAGAQWRLSNSNTWYNSGDTIENLAAGNYTVTFNNVDFWSKPDDISVTILDGQLTTTSGNYTSVPQGSVKVNISPAEAVTDGAAWSWLPDAVGSPLNKSISWFASGTTQQTESGQVKIICKPLLGWAEPANQTVSVTESGLVEINVTYTQSNNNVWPGPDAYGYKGEFSSGGFEDIEATGTEIVFPYDIDEDAVLLDIGFDFPFYPTNSSSSESGYMQNHQQFYVNTNGYLSIKEDYQWNNLSLPSTNAPDLLIAPFWTDLILKGEDFVKYEVRGTAPERRLIIQWKAHHYDDLPSPVEFQAILYETGKIEFHYKDVYFGDSGGFYENGAEATIGMQDAGGKTGLLYLYDGSAVINNDDSIIITRQETRDSSLTVNIDPVEAQGSGGWRLKDSGSDWLAHGDTLSNLFAGSTAIIEFKEVSGFATPADISLVLSSGSNLATGTYVTSGSISITISPQEAIDYGAKWSIDAGENWFSSGSTLSSVAPGTYTVTFKELTYWTSPADFDVTVIADQTATGSGTYTPIPKGYLQVNIGPSQAVTAGARWAVKPETDVNGRYVSMINWKTSGATLLLESGDVDLIFRPLLNWAEPAEMTVTVPSDDTLVVNVNYNESTTNLWPGPDAYGYVGEVSTGGFEDISTTGNDLVIYEGTDTGMGLVELGFDFPFYPDESNASDSGRLNNFTELWVYVDGYISPNSYNYDGRHGGRLPIDEREQIIAPHWDDLAIYSGDYIKYELRGTAPERRMIIQWKTHMYWGFYTSIEFQTILYETGKIEFHYKDVIVDQPGDFFSNGDNASIGIQDASAGSALLYSYYGSAPLENDYSIIITRQESRASSLTVNLNPAGVQATAGWRLAGTGADWHAHGDTITNLFEGSTAEIEFKEVAGYVTPATQTVVLNAGANTATAEYVSAGYLTVNLNPAEAVSAGAQWRRIGTTTWNSSGTTVALVPGNYTIAFNTITNWDSPLNQNVTVTDGVVTTISATYVAQPGSLSVTISPQEAIDAGAQWRRTGTSTWYDSGATESDVPVGSHTVEFSDVTNWYKPSNKSVTISSNNTSTASGTYTFSGLALSAASAECAAGEQTSIDISLSAGDGIEAFGFDLVFDSTKLTLITPVAKGSLVTESFTFDSNLVDANTLRIGGLDSGGGTLNAGAGTVAVVTFEVKEGLAEDTSIPLTITNLTDDILNAQPVSGQITVSECTIDYDINGDGSVTPGDALIVFKHYLGIATITDPCQLQKADANGDDSITPGDALIVFKEYLGLN